MPEGLLTMLTSRSFEVSGLIFKTLNNNTPRRKHRWKHFDIDLSNIYWICFFGQEKQRKNQRNE